MTAEAFSIKSGLAYNDRKVQYSVRGMVLRCRFDPAQYARPFPYSEFWQWPGRSRPAAHLPLPILMPSTKAGLIDPAGLYRQCRCRLDG